TRGQDVVVGQEIWIPAISRQRVRWLAVPALVLVGALIWGQALVPSSQAEAAVLSVDINPSINLNVSAKGTVLSADGLDAGGRRLLGQRKVRGLAVQQAVDLLIQAAAQDGYLKQKAATVLIGAVFLQHPEPWFQGLSTAASGVLRANRVSASVVAVSGVSAALLHAMQTPQVSVGRYLVWQRTPAATRNHLSLNQIRKMSVSDLVAPLVHVAPPTTHTPPAAPESTSPKPSKGASHPPVVLPNLPVTVPTVQVTVPSLALPKVGQHASPPTTSGGSPPSKPPSPAPNPAHTVSSLVSQLGL
ncbi:MAG: hypothetical protein OWR62_15985, partial [Sulfobacillus thermotolerans]|nr:hypothetical protein [Sulfobacillus thermotolerans]